MRKKWNDLSMAEKAEYIGVAVKNNIYKLDDIKAAYNSFAEGGDTDEPQLSDEQYYPIIEKVAHDNWQKWGDSSEDAALERILNDNSYDYRGYYANNPQGQADAGTHWPDTYKTYWHPTFSNESKYSGNKSQFNPTGADGGFWIGETYFPADSYHQAERFNRFDDGGSTNAALTRKQLQEQAPYLVDKSDLRSSDNRIPTVNDNLDYYLSYQSQEPINTGANSQYGYTAPEVVVTGTPVARLTTWHPVIDGKYPFTGHSELYIPTKGFFTKTMDNRDYNLVTNNCSNETGRILEKISGKKIDPFLFTTPGDVRDFAKENFETYTKDDSKELYIKLPKDWRKKLGNPHSGKYLTKKSYGGNLFDDGGGMQQVIYKTDDGRYVLANNEEVTPFSMVGDDSSQWSYIGKNGRIYTPHREVSQGTITEINPFSRQAQELRDEARLNEELNNPTLLTGGLYSAIRNFREGKTPMQALQNVGLMPAYDSENVAGIGDFVGLSRAAKDSNLTNNLLKYADTQTGRKWMGIVPEEQSPMEIRQTELLKDAGIDLTKFNNADVTRMLRKRKELLTKEGKSIILEHPAMSDELKKVVSVFEDWRGGEPVGDLSLVWPAYKKLSDVPNKEQLDKRVLYESANPYIHFIHNHDYDPWTGIVKDRENRHKGVAENMMNGAIEMSQAKGYDGIVSGGVLYSPEATTKIWEHYPVKENAGTGMHFYNNYTEDPTMVRGEAVLLKQPSRQVMLKSNLFDPSIIDAEGRMHIDWSDPTNYLRVGIPVGLGLGYLTNSSNEYESE